LKAPAAEDRIGEQQIISRGDEGAVERDEVARQKEKEDSADQPEE
jgi:hypothetical protein